MLSGGSTYFDMSSALQASSSMDLLSSSTYQSGRSQVHSSSTADVPSSLNSEPSNSGAFGGVERRTPSKSAVSLSSQQPSTILSSSISSSEVESFISLSSNSLSTVEPSSSVDVSSPSSVIDDYTMQICKYDENNNPLNINGSCLGDCATLGPNLFITIYDIDTDSGFCCCGPE